MFNSLHIIKKALKNPKVIESLESLENNQYKGVHLLIISYYYKNFDIVETLLKCDVIRNNIYLQCYGLAKGIANDLYEHALCWFCMYGHTSLAQEILINNHNNLIAKIEGQILSNSLLLALVGKHKDTADLLLTYPEVLEKTAFNSTEILNSAINNGYIDTVEQLLKIDHIQSQLATNGNIFISAAIDEKYPEIVEKLLEFESVQDNIHLNDNAIFFNLITNKYEDSAIRIWQENSAVRTAAADDRSFLIACASGLINLVEKMLDNENIMQIAARDNNQAYEWAQSNSHHDIAQLLFDRCPTVSNYINEHRNVTTARDDKFIAA